VTVNTKVVFVVPLPGSTLPVKTVVPQENAAVGATNQGSTAKSQPTAAIAAASRSRRPDGCVRLVCMDGWPDRTGRPPRPALGPKGRIHRYVRTGLTERSSRRTQARRARRAPPSAPRSVVERKRTFRSTGHSSAPIHDNR
jgi:hypothetical protein